MLIRYSYTDAARRLLKDAVLLWTDGARETAVHLGGLSAECALKSILVGLGLVIVAQDGQIERSSAAKSNEPIRTHINKLWSEFQSRLAGRSAAVYIEMLPVSVPAPFDGWSVDHRYVASSQLTDARLEPWMWAALVIGEVLKEAANRGEAQ